MQNIFFQRYLYKTNVNLSGSLIETKEELVRWLERDSESAIKTQHVDKHWLIKGHV